MQMIVNEKKRVAEDVGQVLEIPNTDTHIFLLYLFPDPITLIPSLPNRAVLRNVPKNGLLC